jgi:hypothetical protein
MKLKLTLLLLLTMELAIPTRLSAQTTPVDNHAPGFELFGGYSYIFKPYDRTNLTPFSGGTSGWDASLRVPVPIFGSWLGVKGDVSGFYRSDQPNFNPHSYFFLLGPQVSLHLGKSTVFADGLVGSSHLNNSALPNLRSASTLAVAVDGGVDIGLTRAWAWRVMAGYYNTNYQSTNHNVSEITNSNVRISVGPVFRF